MRIDAPASADDFRRIASIHKQALACTGFVADCSESFVSYFYKKIASLPSTMLVVARDDTGKVQGFAFGSTKKVNYYREFLRNNFFRVLAWPSVYWPVLKNLHRRFGKRDNGQYSCELVQIAVADAYLGEGTGKLLLGEITKGALERGEDIIYLQVFSENGRAVTFYGRNGFKTEGFAGNDCRKLIMSKRLQ